MNSTRADGRGPVDVLALIDHFAMGGAETLLGRFAAAAPREGIRLQVACLQERDGNPAAACLHELGHPPLNLGLSGRPRLGAVRAVRRLIRTASPQIVHTHLGTSDVLGAIAARSLGVPMVCTIHAMHWKRTDLGAHARRMLVRACAARVIAVSESARRSYLEQGWARPDQIVTINNGIDVEPCAGSGEEVRRELGLGADDFVVGMVSALRLEKGHDLALRAVELLAERFPRLRLVIAGQGSARAEIARLAAPLGDRVVLAGARSDVMRLFDSIDLCLHPSRADAFPTTLIEAMAASVPVLATAVGGIPEIIVDSRTGVLVPAGASAERLASELSDLVEDPARRRALAARARRDYEDRFTADPWIHSTRALYDEVLSQGRPVQSRASPADSLVEA